VIYVVEEQQATYLFACLSEALAFDRQRFDEFRYSLVREYQEQDHSFDPQTPDVPLEFGPGQEKCGRIRRKIHQWWQAREAWWNQLYDY